MCNSCNQNGGGCGCSLLNNFANAINNLFSTQPFCGCPRNNGGCNRGNNGCGCNQGNNGGFNPIAFTNGFVSGVNAANDVQNAGCGCNQGNNGCGCNQGNNGCGCNQGNNGCGCNQGNGCGDLYYARQYALYPFNTTGGVCNCGCGSNNPTALFL